MEEIIAGMHLAERASLGGVFEGALDERRAHGGQGFTFRAAHVSSLPDVVFILGSFAESPTFTRDMLLSAFHPLMDEAMVHYDRSRCLAIVDRDGKSYEVGLGQLTEPPSPERKRIPRKHFGNLKTTSHEVTLRPT